MTQDFADMMRAAVGKDVRPVRQRDGLRYHHLSPDTAVAVVKQGTADVLPVVGVSTDGELIIELGGRFVTAWKDGHDGSNVVAGPRQKIENVLCSLGYEPVVTIGYETWVNKHMIDSGVRVGQSEEA